MATKKYLVRSGFVVALLLSNPNGGTYERTYEGGEEISLDDDQAALHQHKLEFASQKDRDAALAAEREAAIAAAAASNPADLVSMLTKALTQALAASGNAAASTPPAA